MEAVSHRSDYCSCTRYRVTVSRYRVTVSRYRVTVSKYRVTVSRYRRDYYCNATVRMFPGIICLPGLQATGLLNGIHLRKLQLVRRN